MERPRMDDNLPKTVEQQHGLTTTALTELARNAYDDMIKPAAPEVSRAAITIGRFVNFVLYPVEKLAWLPDVIENHIVPAIARQMRRIPKDRFVTPKLHIVGPTLQRLAYAATEPTLCELFAKLLASSMDSAHTEKVLPCFSHIISILSPDEGVALYDLRENPVTCASTQDWSNRTHRPTSQRRIIDISFPTKKLTHPERFEMYMLHLKSLDLVLWNDGPANVTKLDDEHQREQRDGYINLTELGRLFVSACIPDEGFPPVES